MAYFPFFIDVEQKKGLIVGGGRIAAHKIEKLKPFGADLVVIAPKILPQLKEDATLTCIEREFREDDLRDCCFVIAASDDRELNHRISRLCQEQNILVNVVDDKEVCGFLFPALVKEGSLTVGISTAGASPKIAATLRSQMAAELPNRIEEILDDLNSLRDVAKAQILDAGDRAAFLKDAAVFCMAENRVLASEEKQTWVASYAKGERLLSEQGKRVGSVTLVGAGCGSYDLITLRGLRAIRESEVLIYDDLIDERLLDHASESCEKIYVGKRMGAHSKKQEEINTLLVRKAKEGKRVVRLKGGDPFVFGRGPEEIKALKEEGISVTEIPGITSAIAVPAAAGIPVTSRGTGRSFHVMTGHTSDGKDALPEELEQMAGLNGTLVILMGFHHLEQITKRLLAGGKAKETPVAVVHGNFDGTADAVRGTLENIVEKVKQSKLQTPAVIVVGSTVND